MKGNQKDFTQHALFGLRKTRSSGASGLGKRIASEPFRRRADWNSWKGTQSYGPPPVSGALRTGTLTSRSRTWSWQTMWCDRLASWLPLMPGKRPRSYAQFTSACCFVLVLRLGGGGVSHSFTLYKQQFKSRSSATSITQSRPTECYLIYPFGWLFNRILPVPSCNASDSVP